MIDLGGLILHRNIENSALISKISFDAIFKFYICSEIWKKSFINLYAKNQNRLFKHQQTHINLINLNASLKVQLYLDVLLTAPALRPHAN